MKASLVSATSLGALLAFEVVPAHAATIFTLNPGNMAFGDALVNCATCSDTVKETATNATTGVEPMTFGTATGQYSGGGSATLAAGTTSTVSKTYTFAPTVTGAAAAQTVTITGGAATKQTTVVTMTGTGVAPAATIRGSNAGYVLAGATKSVLVTVQNTGNGNLSGQGTISNLLGTVAGATTGANSALFTGTNTPLTNGTNTTGLLDSGSQSVSYVFAPTSIGTFSANVTGSFTNGIGNTNVSGNLTATVAGTGVAPVSSVSVTNPGYVLVNSAANSKTSVVTVMNTGNGALSGLGSVSNLQGVQGASSSSVFTGSGGSISLQDSNATTGNGFATNGSTTATFTYNFAPTATGAVSTTVTSTFTNSQGPNGNYATGTATVTLSGTGVAPINKVAVTNTAGAGGTVGTGNLGYLLVTSQTGTATITLSNIGNGNLAGSGGAFNLNGSISNTVGTGYSGGVTSPTSSVSLNDSHYAGAGATLTQAYSYTFAPTVVGAATTTLTASFSNGSNNGAGQGYNNSQTVTTVVTATGVAPIQSVSTGSALSRFNAYGGTNSGTGTATVTVQNIGNGNLSGLGSISNLNVNNGSINLTSGGSVFAGAAGNSTSLSLGDATTSTLAYVYTPVSRGTSSGTVNIAFANGSNAGTNLSQTVQATITGQGVGPTYQSKVGAVVDTPVVNGGTAHASTINFGTVFEHTTETIDLDIANITTDPNGGNASLTDLTLVDVPNPSGGTDPSAFTIGSYGSLIQEGGTTFLPITLTANEPGTLTGYLTITTDESAALGEAGDTFSYYLSAQSVPEPATLALLGAGVAGLGFVRRRKTR